MAISTKFEHVKEQFRPKYWRDIDEYEKFYLERLSETLADTNYYTDRAGVEREIQPINHHPGLKEYEVWSEGYAATGESGGATLHGKAFARNFAQACHIVMATEHLKWIEKVNAPSYKEYETGGRWDYDPSELSYWGCRLYWSEELARKSFG